MQPLKLLSASATPFSTGGLPAFNFQHPSVSSEVNVGQPAKVVPDDLIPDSGFDALARDHSNERI